jgi:hypothetical protein
MLNRLYLLNELRGIVQVLNEGRVQQLGKEYVRES